MSKITSNRVRATLVALVSGLDNTPLLMRNSIGILFYFGITPVSRHYTARIVKQGDKLVGLKRSFYYNRNEYIIYYSNTCCEQYIADGSRLWIVVGKSGRVEVEKNLSCKRMGYFDGSFLNYNKFPANASMYLFLCDPSPSNQNRKDILFD